MFGKFSDRATHGKIADVKRDFWSDFRNQAYETAGISPVALQVGQAVIDTTQKSLLPPGGNIPTVNNGAIPTADIALPKPGFKITPTIAVGILVVVAAAFYFRKV